MQAQKCELWLGTRTGRFMRWGEFESIAACRRYISDCVDCYHEIRRL